MTEDAERALLIEYLETCARVHSGFLQTVDLASPLLPITAAAMDRLSPHDETWILSFIKRYEQFEDVLQRTLKAIAMIMEHGKVQRLTSVDIARRAYELGILETENVWAEAVRTRNALAHEYPLNPEKRAEQVNRAWNTRETLNTTWQAIGRFVETEGLLA